MIVWLASYPRSGNTLARVVLKDVFGIETPSLAGDGDDRVFSSRPGVIEVVGHLKSATRGIELIEEAQRSDRLYIIKTHEPPLTDDPAIYIVRDGRSAIISYYHYLNEIENLNIPLASVIDGQTYAGSWSDHFKEWRPLERPKTLLLRYEEMIKDSNLMVERLGRFISARPGAPLSRTFEDLHTLFPKFFRKGDDASNIREMGPHLPRFMRLHGALMQRLGYEVGHD